MRTSRVVIARLRAAGFEVISIAETRLGSVDADVLRAADAEDCVLIPEDQVSGLYCCNELIKVTRNLFRRVPTGDALAIAPDRSEARDLTLSFAG